jgi:PAS domain S-box-containing protein
MDRKDKQKDKKTAKTATRKKQAKTVKRTEGSRAAKKIESELAQVDEKLHKMSDLLGDLPQGICFFNKEEVIRYYNESFAVITGCGPELLKGKKLRKNQLWGGRSQKDEFKELFQQAREAVAPITVNVLSINSSKVGQRTWNLNLIPQKDKAGDYDGMELIIEDVTGKKPAPDDSLANALYSAAVQHTETQPLLESLVTVLKDYSGCSSVSIIIVDRVRDRSFKADTDKRAGLWNSDVLLSPAEIDSIFKNGEALPEGCRSNGGSIYLNKISECEAGLTGILKDIVVNSSNSYGYSSMAFIPIRSEGWIQGFIQLANTGFELQPGTVSMIEAVGNQLQIIFEHAGLKDEMRMQREGLLKQMNERNAHLEAMSEHLKQEVSERKKAQEEMRVQRDLALELNEIDDLDKALSLCLDTAIRVAGMDSGGIYLFDSLLQDMVLACDKGIAPEFKERITRYDKDAVIVRLIQQGTPVYMTAGEMDAEMSKRLDAEGIKVLGSIPIIKENNLVAVLNIASHEAGEISYTARNAVEAIAAEIGSVLTRIQSRRAYTESEERYKTLFARTSSPILVVDEEGHYIDANDAALEFMECSREELMAMTVKDTLPPYLDDQWFENYRTVWQTSGIVERDYYVWGKIKVLEMTITPLQLGDRKVIFGIGKDVTEKKRIENELKKSEERYLRHFENVNDVIYSIDIELKITDVSPSVEKVLGYTPGEIIGHTVTELNLISPESLEKAYKNVSRVFGGEIVESNEYKFIHKNGHIVYAEISGAPLYSDGKLVGAVSVARDITDRKKAEEAVRKSEEKYRTILEEMDETYYEIDAKGNFTSANEAMARRFGYTKEEFIGLGYRAVTREEDVSGKVAVFSRVFQTGRPRFWQPIIGVKKDGTIIHLEDSIYPLKNEKGEIIGLRGIGREVTERRLWEAALKESEEKFRRLFYQSPVGVLMVSLDDYRFISVNEAFCSFTGYSDEELVTMSFRDITHPDSIEADLENIGKLVKGEVDQYVTDKCYIKKDGSTVWGHVSVRLIKDVSGSPLYLLPVVEDITARKKAEQDLRRSEAMFKNIIEHSSEMFYIHDTDYKFQYISPHVETLTGYTAEEASEAFLTGITDNPINLNGRRATVKALKTGQKQPPYIMEVLKKNGSIALLEFNETPLKDDQGNVTGMVGMGRDVTEQQKAEEEIRASEQRYHKLADYNQQLNEIYISFTEAVSVKELMTRIAESLRNLTGAKATAVSVYNKASGVLHLLEVNANQALISKVENILNIQVRGLEFAVPDEIKAIMLSDVIANSNDISELSFGAVTREQSDEIMLAAGIGRIVGLSLNDGSELAGTAFAFLPSDVTKEPEDVLKTFSYMAGLAILKKTGENELRASEERFKSIVEHITDVFYIQDVNRELVYISPQVESILGYSVEEMKGGWQGHLSANPMNSDGYNKWLRAFDSGEKQEPYLLEFVNKSGKLLRAEINESPLKDEQGKVMGMVGVARDITERAYIEQALIDSEAKFRDIIEASPDPIWEVDTSGVFTYVSPRILDSQGFEPAELLGKPFFSIIALDKVDEVASKFLEAQTAGVPVYTTQVDSVTKDNKPIVVEIRATKILDNQGNLKGFRGISRDITKQMKAAKALQESEEKYRSVVENAHEGIFVLQDGKFKYGNDHLIHFTSYSPDEILAISDWDSFQSVIHPDDREKIVQSYRKYFNGETVPDHYEIRWIDKGGEVKWASVNLTNITWEGKPATLGFVANITERALFEKALQESEEKYRSVVENANEGIFVLQDGTFKYANDRLISFSRYTREELRQIIAQDPFKAIIHPDDLHMVEQYYIKRLNGEDIPNEYEIRWNDKGGEIKWASINVTSFHWAGKPAILGFVTDVTARKQIEEALASSEEKYRTVLDDMDEYYYEMDPGGNFTFVNDAAEQVFGYTVEELTGMNYKVYTPPEQTHDRVTIFSEVFRTGIPSYSQPLEHVRKDGSRVFVETSILPMRNDKGEIVGLRGVGRDITARIKSEEELQKRALFLDSAYDSIIAYGPDGKIVYANESGCSSRGYTREELLQMNVRQLVPEEGIARLEGRLGKIAQQGELIFEAVHVKKDGTTFPVEAYTRLINVAGKETLITIYRDLTLRRLAEQAVIDSEARFKDMADMLPLVIYEANNEGILTYFNNRALEAFGFSSEEMANSFSVFRLIDTSGVEAARSSLQNILEGSKNVPHEYIMVRKDGSKFDGLIYSSRIMKGDQVTGFRGVLVDISSLKKAEQILRESEEKYRSVIENAGEAIYIAQADRLVFCNERTLEILEYAYDEAVSRPFTEFIHPDDREMVKERYLARLKGGVTPEYYTFRLITGSGKVKWIGLRATAIQWEGNPATLNFSTDVSEIIKAENAVRESEERYRLLADNSMDIIVTTSMDLEITYISPSVRYMLGRTADEIFKMYREGQLNAEKLGLSEADADMAVKGMRALVQDPSRTQVFELEFRHRDGFTSWAEIKMSIMRDKSGQAAGILGVIRDVTQQKKMTERLIRSDRLASLGEMAAGLAHEVNNPLTAVMGFAYLVLQNPNTPPEVKNDINSIYNEGKRAADVIKNFLIFARGRKPERQAVFINDIIESTLRLRHSQMTKENITVLLNLAEDLPAINGDVSQLQQVFLNIILNAEHFMYQTNKKGTLAITTLQEEGRIKVLIKDDGPGIPQEKIGRVFDPFYTTKQVGEGTGLGLSICHGIISEHGGNIYAESRQGEGATFIIDLPGGN